MVRRILVVVALLVVSSIGAAGTAAATCQQGTVEIKPKPRVELPHCEPHS